MHWFHLSSYKFRIIRSSEGAELAPLCLSPAFPETVLPETMAGYGRVYVPSLRNYVIHSHLNGCQWRRSKSFLSLLPAFLEFSCPFLHVGSPRSQASSVLPTGIPRQEMASNGKSLLISLPWKSSIAQGGTKHPPVTMTNSSFGNFCCKGNLQISLSTACVSWLTGWKGVHDSEIIQW